jgi:hypothetical protein
MEMGGDATRECAMPTDEEIRAGASLLGTCASFADLKLSKKSHSMSKRAWYVFGLTAAALLAMTGPKAIKETPPQLENVGVQEPFPDWRLVTERNPYMRSER